jgi:hypothetical protein
MHILFIRTLLFAVAIAMLSMSSAAFAQVAMGVVVTFAPPPLPVYEQPLCPGEGYIWTPGYWAYGDDFDDYYWVPGTWVLAPEIGFLWTPGYWAWGGESFVFYDGYWGPRVGFYGGIAYGFGYFGEGYEGGRWENGRFFYNTTVNNVNITEIHNVYNAPVNNTTVTRVSYNGGNGGINRRPKPEEEAAAREKHIPPASVQIEHAHAARTNPELRASVNMGKPPVAATPKPGVFKDRGVVPAKEAGGSYTPPANRGKNQARNNATASRPENRPENNASRPSTPVHPRDLSPAARPSAPNTGNPKLDQKYQQQQEKQYAKQEQERQKLQQKQDREDQRLAQQKADEGRKQQTEQRHQQQTQQLQQKHEQQQRQTQEKQQPRQKPDKQQPPDRNKPPN